MLNSSVNALHHRDEDMIEIPNYKKANHKMCCVLRNVNSTCGHIAWICI